MTRPLTDPEAPVQPTPSRDLQARGPAYDNLLHAREVISEALVAHLGSASADRIPMVSLSYVGILHRAGHFATPGRIDDHELQGLYVVDSAQGRALHEGTLIPAEGAEPLETLVVVTDRAATSRGYGQAEAETLHHDARLEAMAELRMVVPHEVLRDALEHASSLRWIGEHDLDGRSHRLVGYVDEVGRSWVLQLDSETMLLSRAERLLAHPIEGDAAEWIEFSGYTEVEGIQLPRERQEQRVEATTSWSRELEFTALEVGGDDPAVFASPREPPEQSDPGSPAVVELAAGVHLLELPEYDVKVAFVAFDDHCVVLEAPLSSEVGEAIIAAVDRTHPDKPIRYLAMSHHHPHYTAGLRPFVHAGVTLITTPGNESLLESIASRPHRIRPDAQQRRPRAPVLELVEGRRELSDDTATLQIFDVGPHSGHTEEYLVFYLPEHRLLFEGDLGWLPREGQRARARRGAKRLLAIVDELGIEVERVVQSWPLAGQLRAASIEQLRAWAEDDDG